MCYFNLLQDYLQWNINCKKYSCSGKAVKANSGGLRLEDEKRSTTDTRKIPICKSALQDCILVVTLLTCTSFVLCIITVQIMNKYVLNEIIKRGESVGKSVAASAGYSLLSKDLLSLDNLVFQAKSSNSDMEYVAIVTPDKKTIAHSEMTMSGGIVPVSQGKLIRKSQDGTTVKELSRSSDSLLKYHAPLSL